MPFPRLHPRRAGAALLTATLLVGSLVTTAHAAATDEWMVDAADKRMRLSVAAPDGTQPVAGFPVAVHLTPDTFEYPAAAPDRLRFVVEGEDGAPLPYEVETWDPDGESTVWVRMPELSTDAVTVGLYYDGVDVRETAPHEVWDDGFELVHHFADADTRLTDSTANGNDGVPVGGPTFGASGRTGAALGLDGVDDLVNFGSAATSLTHMSVSVDAYLPQETIDRNYAIMVARDLSGGSFPNEQFIVGLSRGSYNTRYVVDGDMVRGANLPAVVGWNNVTMTYDGEVIVVYVNGISAGRSPVVGQLDPGIGIDLTAGAYGNSKNFAPMTIDELRISNEARDANWVALEQAARTGELVTATPTQDRDGAAQVALTSITDGAVVDSPVLPFTGTVTGSAVLSYRLDDGPEVELGTVDSVFGAELTGLTTGEHTLEVIARSTGGEARTTVDFTVSGSRPPAAPVLHSPADGAVLPGTAATLGAEVADPTADPLTVDFYEVVERPAAVVEDGVVAGSFDGPLPDAPFRAAPRSDAVTLVGTEDGAELVTEGTDGSLYQQYDVDLGELTDRDVAHVRWVGSSDRAVSLYAWRYDSGTWARIGDAYAEDGAPVEIDATIDAATMSDGGVARILVHRGVGQDPTRSRLPGAGEFDFSIAWIPDTQYYSESFPEHFDAITTDIVAQREQQRTEYVVHTGDIVEHWNARAEWDRADASMRVLDDAGVAYGVLAGNHDNGSSDADSRHAFYDEYFPGTRPGNLPVYGEGFRENENHYDLLTAGGVDFVVLYLSYSVNESELEWAEGVLSRFPDRKAIIATHEYLDADGELSTRTGTRFDPQLIEERLVRPFENVFLVLGGHNHGAALNLREIGDRTVVEMLADYQNGPEGGSGYYRYLSFDAQNGLMYVNTYSAVRDDRNFFGDLKDQFVVEVPLANDAQRRLATDLLDVSVGQTDHIGTVGPVPSGTTASLTWEGLTADSEYTWFARATDPSGNVVGAPPYTFTTAAATPGGPTSGGETQGDETPEGEAPEESLGSPGAGSGGAVGPDTGTDESLAVTGTEGVLPLVGAALLALVGTLLVLRGRRRMHEV